MKRYSVLCIVAVMLLGAGIFFSDTPYCQQGDKKFVILFSHNLEGSLEPCG
jgi:hypothetical protein